MKNWNFTPHILALVMAVSSIFYFSEAKAQIYGQVSLDIFYNELSPYGNWDRDPHYGEIWYPNAGRDFRPYSSNGYWTMTEYGNTWVSNYDWGWAPFHYGRWVYNSYRGWGWIPGYEWGPAWVEWRTGNGYYGWAPMMPSRSGISISINLPISSWVFAPVRYIYSRNFHRYSSYGRTNIYNRTTVINNTYIVNNNHYYGGPARRDVERALGRSVQVRNIRQSARPGASRVDSRSVSIYRPDRDNSRSANRSATSPSRGTALNSGTNRATTARSAASTRNISREMYIDSKGDATIRQRTAAPSTTRTNANTSSQAPLSSTTNRTAVSRGSASSPVNTASRTPAAAASRSSASQPAANRGASAAPAARTTQSRVATTRPAATSARTLPQQKSQSRSVRPAASSTKAATAPATRSTRVSRPSATSVSPRATSRTQRSSSASQKPGRQTSERTRR